MSHRPSRRTRLSSSSRPRTAGSGLPTYDLDLDWCPRNYGEKEGPFPRRNKDDEPFSPGEDPREVAIAWISLGYQFAGEGTTFLARRQGGRYHYRAEETHGNEVVLCRKTSRRPLTLEQVILLVHTSYWPDYDGVGRGIEFWWASDVENGSWGLEAILKHTVESDVYPQLGPWFKRHARWWWSDRMAAEAEKEGREAAGGWRQEQWLKAAWARWKAEGS
jgi:hypothetical protein